MGVKPYNKLKIHLNNLNIQIFKEKLKFVVFQQTNICHMSIYHGKCVYGKDSY